MVEFCLEGDDSAIVWFKVLRAWEDNSDSIQ